MSSSMMFYAGMEKERGQGGGKKENYVSFALCMYLYVVCSVQIYLASTRNLLRKRKKGENHKKMSLIKSPACWGVGGKKNTFY